MSQKPRVVMSSLDADRIDRLLDSLPAGACPHKAELCAELDRADVVEPAEIPPDIVTMRSTVRIRIGADGEASLRCTLVYPDEVDPEGRGISILAPVGSALLGLSSGDSIDWPRPDGGTMHVRVDEIVYQPERAGHLHR